MRTSTIVMIVFAVLLGLLAVFLAQTWAQRIRPRSACAASRPPRNGLLTAQAENCLRTQDGGRVPLAGEYLRLRRLNAQCQGKRPSGGSKPVGILALTRTFVLKIEIEGTVRVVLERHPTTDGKPIECVRNREALCIIKCNRPKSACRRRRAVVEMNRIFVCPVDGFAGVVAEVEGIYSIFGNVRTQP
jgi:hypothetical protein